MPDEKRTPAAGGVVQPPADREVEREVRVLAGYIAEVDRVLTPEGATRIATYLHGRGWRRVPEGHQVVPGPWVCVSEEGERWEVEMVSVPADPGWVWNARLRPLAGLAVGAAGGEGTDGDRPTEGADRG